MWCCQMKWNVQQHQWNCFLLFLNTFWQKVYEIQKVRLATHQYMFYYRVTLRVLRMRDMRRRILICGWVDTDVNSRHYPFPYTDGGLEKRLRITWISIDQFKVYMRVVWGVGLKHPGLSHNHITRISSDATITCFNFVTKHLFAM